MTYQFPESLHPLRNWLRKQGLHGDSIKTSRQAAFMAQQLLGSRIKFPPQGSDMTSTLFLIQKQLPAVTPKSQQDTRKAVNPSNSSVTPKQASLKLVGKGKKATKSLHKPERPIYLQGYDPKAAAVGYHVYADGACVPNPGPGGWGFVVHKDGQEIASDSGGDVEATNNTMELTALLKAIEWARQYPSVAVCIWTDSQYAVKGVHEWMAGWKRNGWQRGGANAEPQNRILLNSDLWQAIDAALSGPRASNISVKWIKGHAGHVGNERADELAEMGRQQLSGISGQLSENLDAEYRAVMAG